ncbi:response regulator transcription factor [Streptococcus moroccensis]|uniref:Heme response regulator HssR n=1 Tax=Streptococcus moroccensis TaxID=1451356 RepID=A0ABT9YRM8_9STRE|nr:response regulator transcription factor [Streptococcus moroccensis]MDQ0222261.1 DNA-binding response OmpR family regulator [Streptococcus moroccensis]
MATILIAEDDQSIQLLLKDSLEESYSILTADDGLTALTIIENGQADLLITDIMMPKMDGQELVKEIRAQGNTIPILMLTAKQALTDKKEGFLNGADDYLTKPVNIEELSLRLVALLRRANISAKHQIKVGETVLDETTYTITSPNQTLELPKKEFQLLFKLLSYPNHIFTQTQLLDDIWGLDSYSSEDTVKTHVSRIRKSCQEFSDFSIKTVRGLGYKGELHEKISK